MILRSSIKAYGLLLVVFAVVVSRATDVRIDQRDVVLQETVLTATQQSQLIAKGISVFHIGASFLLDDVLSRVDGSDLKKLTHDKQLAQRYNALLVHKLALAPYLNGLSIVDKGCSNVAANDVLHLGFKHPQTVCDELVAVSGSDRLRVWPVGAGMTPLRGPEIIFSRNFPDQNDVFQGAVITGLDLGFMRDWLGRYMLRDNESIALLSEQGKVLAHFSYEMQVEGLEAVFSQMMVKGHISEAPGSFLSGSYTYQDDEAVYAMSKIDDLPMYVLVGFGVEKQLSAWRDFSVQTGAFIFVLFVLSLASVSAHLRVVAQREELAQLATTDALTGLHNRRHLMKVGNYEVSRAHRYDRPLSMLLVDADHFKDINDTWGHGVGDTVLKALSQAIESNLRQTDVAARIGGEEFVILLPETTLENALVFAQRLRESVEAISVQVNASSDVGLTVSIGVAMLKPDDTLDKLMSRADRHLYVAKEKGRNQVVTAQD